MANGNQKLDVEMQLYIFHDMKNFKILFTVQLLTIGRRGERRGWHDKCYIGRSDTITWYSNKSNCINSNRNYWILFWTFYVEYKAERWNRRL